jgi:RNA-binding protein
MDERQRDLSGADRRHLRRLAHPLRAVVQVGAAGVTDAVVAAVDRALDDHELVKLKLAHERTERAKLAAELARRTGSVLAGTVGQVAILYRPARDPEARHIELPSGLRRPH